MNPGDDERVVSLEEHVLLMYRMDRVEKELGEMRSNQSRVVWLMIGTVFSVASAILVAALMNQGAFT